MFLLEHDAKQLLAGAGIPVPEGVFATGLADLHLPPRDDGTGWVVKAQVRAGGRGKQGGIRLAPTWADAKHETEMMIGRVIGGHTVRAVRIERRVDAALEVYLSLSVAPAERQVRIILSAIGGIEIETLHQRGGIVQSALADPTPAAVIETLSRLAEKISGSPGAALRGAGLRLVPQFFAHDLTLLELNPLFVNPDGSWCAGDAKIVVDDNATMRQPFLRQLLMEKPRFYPDEARKEEHGFDYIVLDEAGEIGLLTTGAGLSMLLIDELQGVGLRPYNFLDVRTGGMHGDPSRLIQVLRWIAEGLCLRVVFCNIFAGSTDLGAFARLLVQALEAVPALTVPVVIRLVGNGAEQARAVLDAAGLSMISSLDEAVVRLRGILAGTA